jgi:hypothetical protein
MKTITVKRPSFLASNYSVFVNGTGPQYSTVVRFTWHDPQEIVLHAQSKRSDEIIQMVPTKGEKKTGYGERAEYSVQNWGGTPFGFLEIEGRVNPTIRLMDANRSELGVFNQRNVFYSLIRTLLRQVLPNYYVCKSQGHTLFTASEIYTPIVCRVKIRMNETAHDRMAEFAICCGLWVACTPSF